jgi:transcriptional regulator with XRE-family HTH domain
MIGVMPRTTRPSLPSVRRELEALGERIRLARLRRRLSATLLAERAGMTRKTLAAVERGDAGVTIGSYANVLHSLGLVGDLGAVGQDDELGRKLQDANLPGPKRRSS